MNFACCVNIFTACSAYYIQRVSDKRSELKALDRKVRPMEDMFAKFRAWLEESKASLSSLTPPPSLAEGEQREKVLKQAEVSACV